MQTNSDFRDLFAAFNAVDAEYLVVGALALAAFGAPLDDLTVKDLASSDLIFQIGVPPLRIDIITSIDDVEFVDAWPERVSSEYADQPVNVVSRRHRIQNKKAVGRLQDLADVEALEGGGD